MAESEVVYVTLAPRGAPTESAVEAVAKLLKKDVFAVRVILNAKIPKVAGYYQDPQNAESVAQGLRSLGYPVIVCRDSELRQRLSGRFVAHALQLAKRQVSFLDKSGQTRTFEEGSLFLMLRGTTRTHVEKGAGAGGVGATGGATLQPRPGDGKTKMSINLPATLATGIPIVRMTKEKPKARAETVQYGEFLWLYDRKSSSPVVEILQSSFDYSSLGAKKALSSTLNFNVIIAELKARFPQAIFDSRLKERFKADVPFATPEEEVEINGRLIYLHYRAQGGSNTSD